MISPKLIRFAGCMVLGFTITLTWSASAWSQTFTILYGFKGRREAEASALVRDAAGNLLGICAERLYRIDPDNNKVTLLEFSRAAGKPTSLIMDDLGNVYGTTYPGGVFDAGILFRISPAGEPTALYDFGPQLVFAYVMARDARGSLYGLTEGGGDSNQGALFKFDKDGTYTTLHSFDGVGGALPLRVIRDRAGNLFGITQQGGAYGFGTIFKLSKDLTYTVLYSFQGLPDGALPSDLFLDASGDLYGATTGGGASNHGTVFKLTKAGEYSQLYYFRGGQFDGWYPTSIVVDEFGTVFGTTDTIMGDGKYHLGSLFKIDPSGTQTVLHGFNANEGYPPNHLIMDQAGNLYGTTSSGGTNDIGMVFRWSPQ